MTKIVYTIPNISCKHCVRTIDMELRQLTGVQSIEGDLQNKTVTIIYGSPADDVQIRRVLSKINYPAI